MYRSTRSIPLLRPHVLPVAGQYAGAAAPVRAAPRGAEGLRHGRRRTVRAPRAGDVLPDPPARRVARARDALPRRGRSLAGGDRGGRGRDTGKDAELDLARQVIDSLVADFEPKELESVYRGNLRSLLEAKLAGQEITKPEPVEEDAPVDRPHGGAARVRRAGVEEVGRGEETGAGSQERRGRDVAQALTAIERYLLLGLRLGRHIDGFVDAYYGASELAAQVDAEALVPAEELAVEAAALAADLDLGDAGRTAWLEAQLLGCETTARRLAGEPISWADEVEACYGVRPDPVPEERFAAAHERVAAALPADGALADRYQAWVESQTVPPEKLLAAAEAFSRELRSRTEALVGLPDDESLHFEEVANEPWSAFNYYLGGRRSRVVVNTDRPVDAFFLPLLIAHEAYPGHHTEHAWKEALLVDGEGYVEETIFLVGTPQAVVSEGIAMIALELVLGDEIDAVAARVFASVGIAYEEETSRAVRELRDALSAMPVNAARLLHVEGRSREEVIDYLERWGLNTRERAVSSVEFLVHPTGARTRVATRQGSSCAGATSAATFSASGGC